jgi:3-phenylpropionate/trans-cinnamate dioxygenase ferredoxin reductase subunit
VLRYDALVVATGARPRTPPFPVPEHGWHDVRTIGDVTRLRGAISESTTAIVLGGGFIGCEVAASLRTVGLSVDLVEMLSAPLIRVLGAAGSQVVSDLHRSHDVRLHTGVVVAEVLRDDDRVRGVRTTNGAELSAPHIIAGIGVQPNVEWLGSCGIDLGNGVICDSGGATSMPRVYAVGDVACWYHPLVERHHRVEHWTTAVDQAEVVASNVLAELAGEEAQATLARAPYFWSDQYDMKIQAVGFVDPSHDVEVLRPDDRTLILYSSDGVLRAAVGFAAGKRVMKMSSLIEARATLDEAIDQARS